MVKLVSTTPHPDVVQQVVCQHCGATLEYVPNDVHERTEVDYEGYPRTYYWVGCPNCSKRVTVKKPAVR